MGKNKCFAISVALLLCGLPKMLLAGPKIYVRLRGGPNYLQAGDVNPGTQALLDWGRTYFNLLEGDAPGEGHSALHLGFELGADLIFELSHKIGVGIGAGYLQSSKMSRLPSTPVSDSFPGYFGTLEFYSKTKLSAIPLRLFINLNLPLKGKFAFNAGMGIAYYLRARCDAEWDMSVHNTFMEDLWQRTRTTAEKKGIPLGFHGELGIEYSFRQTMAFFIEARGSYARFRGLKGTTVSNEGFWGSFFPPYSESGKLYYESLPMIPGNPRLVMVQSSPPAGTEGKPREAEVDFSGVALQTGVRIRF